MQQDHEVAAPAPKSKRHRSNSSPPDLAERLAPLGTLRAKALLRQAFGELDDASSVLERIGDALRLLDEAAPDETVPAGTRQPGERRGPHLRRSASLGEQPA
jgi:hypothetical protein